jgi:hypothetical protein
MNLLTSSEKEEGMDTSQPGFFVALYAHTHYSSYRTITPSFCFVLLRRFVLFDPKTNLWYEVSDDYAREKVSHSLRSRPINEQQRRTKPKVRKKALRKHTNLPALDSVVQQLIQDQQQILNMMIQKESIRVTSDVVFGKSIP